MRLARPLRRYEPNMITYILNALWPSLCISCDEPIDEPGLCRTCRGTLVPAADVSCSHCANVFLNLPGPSPNYRCGRCLLVPPKYHQCRAAYAYGGALRDAIVKWKNHPRPEVGNVLSRLMLSQLDAKSWSQRPHDTVVVPVPTSFRRSVKRGFNPAGQLARALARELDLECHPSVLTLKMHLQSSRGLTRGQRRHRVAQRFTASRVIATKNILLVDDVRTTGKTVNEASRALLRAGAARVDVAVLAAVPDQA